MGKLEESIAILELDNGLTDDSLLAAYRRKAKQYHPDRSKNSAADFIAVKNAYDFLKNHLENPSQGNRINQQKHQGSSFYTISIPLEKVMMGGAWKIRAGKPMVCTACKGSKRIKVTMSEKCSKCGGTGVFMASHGIIRVKAVCPSCEGTGETDWVSCDKCNSDGFIDLSEDLTVDIPPGIENLTILKVPNGSGYVNVQVTVLESDKFKRQGADLYTSINVSFIDACLGVEKQIKLLNDKLCTIEIPPNTQPNAKLIYPSLGLPINLLERGNLYIKVNVQIPKEFSRKQLQLLCELKELEQ